MPKKEKSDKKNIAVFMILATVLILAGTLWIIDAFYRSSSDMRERNENHLTETAWTVDQTMDIVFRNTRKQLDNMLKYSEDAEISFLEEHDTGKMLDYLEAQPVNMLDCIYSLMLMEGENILLNSSDDAASGYYFPDGIVIGEPCLCSGESENFLAIVVESPYTELRYAALIDLEKFYSYVVPDPLMRNFWLVFYNKNTGIFLHNDDTQPEVLRYTVEEALERNDGISILVTGEIEQRSITELYSFMGTDELICVIPTVEGSNGVFTVGVAIAAETFMSRLNDIFWMMAGSILTALSGVLILAATIIKSRHINQGLREKVELLELEKQGMQEIAHSQRLGIIGTMTSGIAHEFNNLLTPIMSYSILAMEELPAEYTEIMDDLIGIYGAAERAKSLVARISALSRKNTEVSYRLFSPDRLLYKVQELVDPSFPPRVKVVMDLKCPEVRLYANETRIAQLLLNIEINALQAMKENGGTLTISSYSENGNVMFRFSDTGPGIASEDLPHIFDPFFTTKEPGRGTGLGLSISRQIAESHGGTITVESKPGAGTVFTVTLPEKPAQSEEL